MYLNTVISDVLYSSLELWLLGLYLDVSRYSDVCYSDPACSRKQNSYCFMVYLASIKVDPFREEGGKS